jgi:hypothetical protein
LWQRRFQGKNELPYRGMAEPVERLLIEDRLRLSVLGQEVGRHHEVFDARFRAAVAIARVTDLAVTAVAQGFSFVASFRVALAFHLFGSQRVVAQVRK